MVKDVSTLKEWQLGHFFVVFRLRFLLYFSSLPNESEPNCTNKTELMDVTAYSAASE